MKKFLALSLVLALGVCASQVSAVDVTNGRPPSLSAAGGTMGGNTLLQFGNYPGAQAGYSVPLIAACTLTQYDALVLVAGRQVSKTTTVGDVNFIGFAKEAAAYGAVVQVQRDGVILARVGNSYTAGDRVVMSAAAGFVTPTSQATAANYLSTSGTPIVARVLDTYTYSAAVPLTLVIVGNR